MLTESFYDTYLWNAEFSGDERFLAAKIGRKLRLYDWHEQKTLGEITCGFIYNIAFTDSGVGLFVMKEGRIEKYSTADFPEKLWSKRLNANEFDCFSVLGEELFICMKRKSSSLYELTRVSDDGANVIFLFGNDELLLEMENFEGRFYITSMVLFEHVFVTCVLPDGTLLFRREVILKDGCYYHANANYESKHGILTIPRCTDRTCYATIVGFKLHETGQELAFTSPELVSPLHSCFFGEEREYMGVCCTGSFTVLSMRTGEILFTDRLPFLRCVRRTGKNHLFLGTTAMGMMFEMK